MPADQRTTFVPIEAAVEREEAATAARIRAFDAWSKNASDNAGGGGNIDEVLAAVSITVPGLTRGEDAPLEKLLFAQVKSFLQGSLRSSLSTSFFPTYAVVQALL